VIGTTQHEAGKQKLRKSYRKLLGLARGAVRQADRACGDLTSGALEVTDAVATAAHRAVLEQFVPLVKRVIAQTQARVIGGDTHHPEKVLSLFEEHSQVIRKGKPHKETEFGRVVRVAEVENGIISDFAVADGNPADQTQLVPALAEHLRLFGTAPDLVTADRGFASAANEAAARAHGVKRVVIPRPGPLPAARRAVQRKRSFRRALRWRVGIEGRIGILKHCFGMLRARYKGDRGFKRHVALSMIANNLTRLGEALGRKDRSAPRQKGPPAGRCPP
jgi:IS5 family transposase